MTALKDYFDTFGVLLLTHLIKTLHFNIQIVVYLEIILNTEFCHMEANQLISITNLLIGFQC